MKEIKISPALIVEADDGATAAFNSKSVYIKNVDNSRKVRAVLTTSGTFSGSTVTVKFQDAADDSTWVDVTDGAFTPMTVAGTETIEFTLGSAIHNNTGLANYGKFLSVYCLTADGTGSDIDIQVDIDQIFVPDSEVLLKLYPEITA